MDPVQIIEKFGIPIAFCLGLAWFIYKQNKYIQDDLTKDIHQKFNRLEAEAAQQQSAEKERSDKQANGVINANCAPAQNIKDQETNTFLSEPSRTEYTLR